VLQSRQDALFWDTDDGGWFSTTGDDPTVLLRLKEEYDGAEPASGSISVANLITLGHLTADPEALARAERTLARFGPRIGAAARVIPMMLAGLSAWHAPHSQVAIAGDPAAAATQALYATIARRYLPFTVVIPLADAGMRERQAALLPYTAWMRERGGEPAAYVCRDFVCREPVTTAGDLDAALRQPR
jgi:uncharacterized protein YyaL (SSP411 family)